MSVMKTDYDENCTIQQALQLAGKDLQKTMDSATLSYDKCTVICSLFSLFSGIEHTDNGCKWHACSSSVHDL